MSLGNGTAAGRQTGTLKWFSRDKGYGFIYRSGQRDVFLHANVLPRDDRGQTVFPEVGQELRFDAVDNGEKGERAVNVVF